MQVSAHAKERMKERLDNWSPTTKPVKIFETALKYGKSIKQFYGTFREYLEVAAAKMPQTSLIVYAGNVYVYEIKRKILITVWNIPEEYQPWKDYLKVNRQEVTKIEALNKKEEAKLLKKVREEGVSPKHFIGEFKTFLMNYSDWTVHVKVYEDNVYVYDAANNILIESFNVPDQYKPIKNYIKSNINEKEGNNMNELEELIASRPKEERRKGRISATSELAIYDSKLLKLGYKECRECGSVKKVDEFSPRQGGDGYQSYCKECHQAKYPTRTSSTKTIKTNITNPTTVPPVTPPTKPTNSKTSYSIESINQAFGFNNYLNEHNITPKAFNEFLTKYKDMSEALTIFNHLSEESRELYRSMNKEVM